MNPIRHDNGILLWADKNSALSKIFKGTQAIVMVHPHGACLDHRHAHMLNIVIRGMPLVTENQLFFLTTEKHKDTINSLFDHLRQCGSKDRLNAGDHHAIGTHLGFSPRAIDMLLQTATPGL